MSWHVRVADAPFLSCRKLRASSTHNIIPGRCFQSAFRVRELRLYLQHRGAASYPRLRAGVQVVASAAQTRGKNRNLALQWVQPLVQDERFVSQGDAPHAAALTSQALLRSNSTLRRTPSVKKSPAGWQARQWSPGLRDSHAVQSRSQMAGG